MLTNLAQAGASLASARAAVILLHGRGASAGSILTLVDELFPLGSLETQSLAFLAPQAPGYTWYPYSFLAPIDQNEPYLSRALNMLSDLLSQLQQHHLPSQRVALLGFSQGACLALEFAVRHAHRYGAVIALSGGLIGPPGATWNTSGSLAETPVFLGCSDVDPHIPKSRVLESAQVLERKGAQVTTHLYPNLGHTINEDEITFTRQLLRALDTT